MIQVSKQQQRNSKIASIKLSLGQMKIFHQTTTQIQSRLSEGSNCKMSQHLTDNDRPRSNYQSDSNRSFEKCRSLFADKYRFGEKIGEGAHGIVKKCYHKLSGQLNAVKTIKLDREHIIFLKENFTDIKRLSHKNILGYKALFLEMNKQQCHLVMDYLPFPDLLHIKIQSEQQLKQITYQIIETLAYIHSHKICHRDIKPENILYDVENKNIKIIDFGISKKLMNRGIKKDMLTHTGTLYYRAPEMFEGGGYDQMVDLWALGVTIFKLMTGVTPFESEYHNQTISNIIKGEFKFPPEAEAKYSKSARNLVLRLLKKREQRLTAKEALMDIWLIQLYQNADDITRSLALRGRVLRIFGQSCILNHEVLTRPNTLKGDEKMPKETEQIFNQMREKQYWSKQQDSMIYCYDQEMKERVI